jgi:hypothetical protein
MFSSLASQGGLFAPQPDEQEDSQQGATLDLRFGADTSTTHPSQQRFQGSFGSHRGGRLQTEILRLFDPTYLAF